MAPVAISQVASGARAIQVFDSWVGALAATITCASRLPYSRALIERIRSSGVPVIYFGTGASGYFRELHAGGGDVMGVDWRMNIDQAWMDISYRSAIQGNLDPVALFAPLPELKTKVTELLRRKGTRPGQVDGSSLPRGGINYPIMHRRDFLNAGAAALPLQIQAMAQAAPQAAPRYNGKPALKITDIQTFLVDAGGRNLCFVKVLTDQGIVGWGEAYSVGPDEATVATIRDFKGWLVGKDPRNVEYLWATMYNFTRFPGGAVINAAISGIEHALWDISGKAAGLPVYMLLGGKCRDKVRCYQSAGGSTPQQLAASAKSLIAKYGYTAIKMAPHPNGSQHMPWNAVTRAVAERSEAVRNAVGPDIDLAYDAHATIFEPIRAFQMAEALKPSRPFWIEEPLRMENMDAMSALKQKIQIPLATGECLYTKFDFRELLAKQAADIIQPDICLAGGIMELKKIAGMADAHYVVVAPHNPMGPLATMVNVHFAASTPNFLILEYHPDDEAPRKDLIKDPILVKDGYLPIPDKPGWGYEVNEEAFRHHPATPWHRGFAFGADGAPDYI